jgi:hypothetical protein
MSEKFMKQQLQWNQAVDKEAFSFVHAPQSGIEQANMWRGMARDRGTGSYNTLRIVPFGFSILFLSIVCPT